MTETVASRFRIIPSFPADSAPFRIALQALSYDLIRLREHRLYEERFTDAVDRCMRAAMEAVPDPQASNGDVATELAVVSRTRILRGRPAPNAPEFCDTDMQRLIRRAMGNKPNTVSYCPDTIVRLNLLERQSGVEYEILSLLGEDKVILGAPELRGAPSISGLISTTADAETIARAEQLIWRRGLARAMVYLISAWQCCRCRLGLARLGPRFCRLWMRDDFTIESECGSVWLNESSSGSSIRPADFLHHSAVQQNVKHLPHSLSNLDGSLAQIGVDAMYATYVGAADALLDLPIKIPVALPEVSYPSIRSSQASISANCQDAGQQKVLVQVDRGIRVGSPAGSSVGPKQKTPSDGNGRSTRSRIDPSIDRILPAPNASTSDPTNAQDGVGSGGPSSARQVTNIDLSSDQDSVQNSLESPSPDDVTPEMTYPGSQTGVHFFPPSPRSPFDASKHFKLGARAVSSTRDDKRSGDIRSHVERCIDSGEAQGTVLPSDSRSEFGDADGEVDLASEGDHDSDVPLSIEVCLEALALFAIRLELVSATETADRISAYKPSSLQLPVARSLRRRRSADEGG